jgi:putative aldouronate transport system permease protein
MIIRELKLLNTIWALVLPTALNIWNVILMTNFFKEIPSEIEEAAFIDGSSHWQILWFVVLPMSEPVIAALSLLRAVGHWNAWFDDMILMSDPQNYPMQSYLGKVVVNLDMRQPGGIDPRMLVFVSDRVLRAAQILVATVPILIAYPFLQQYFITGIKLGALKE